jgi:hypothetical protein
MAVASANRTVVGVFKSMDDAQRAFDALQTEGFSRDEISFIANKNAQHSWGGDDARTENGETASNVAADAGIGAALGGVGGLLLSFAGSRFRASGRYSRRVRSSPRWAAPELARRPAG